jgi:phosphatidylserine/phosphatidylglycerophosphate/cardiolipin synthase-like enzyme
MSDDYAINDDGLFASHPKAVDLQPGHVVTPLIGGMQTFAAIEKAIAEAKESVHMAYWTLDPSIKTTAEIEAETLLELMRQTIERGVTLRIVIADFDPVIGTTFHRDAWKAYRKLMAIADGLDTSVADRLQVMCSRHDTRWGPVARTAAQPILRAQLHQKIDAINAEDGIDDRLDRVRDAPGLWPFIDMKDGRAVAKTTAFPGFYPAAHHEKLCVIDDRTVFLGGLDITEKRKDDWDHDNDFPWHDVACRLEGPVAAFFARHFRSRWNEEFMKAATPPDGIARLPWRNNVSELQTEVADIHAVKGGTSSVKPLRTMSKQSRSWWSRSPRTQITEIRDTYFSIFDQAERFLYIENQYIRSTAAAEALAKRARENRKLELILVLPLMAEDAFVEDEPNIATRHGQYLQEKNTDILRDAFGSRLGIFAMQMPRQKDLPDPEEDEAEEIIENTIYIHAKTLVCDDHTAIIGSANLNDRSLLIDTETAILWQDETAVRDYRVALWQHALDLDTSDWDGSFLKRWKAIAKANAKGDPDERSGFAVPFPKRHLDAHARKSWLVPDELV